MTSSIQIPRSNSTRHMPNTEEIKSPSSTSPQTHHSDLPIQPRMRAETSSPREGSSSALDNMPPRKPIGAKGYLSPEMEGSSSWGNSNNNYSYLRDSHAGGALGRNNRLLVAAMNQSWARSQRFTPQEATRLPNGFCVGVSAIWMRLHQSYPEINGDARMHTLMSPEGITHASIAERSLQATVNQFTAAQLQNTDAGTLNQIKIQSRQSMEQLYAIDGNWAKHRTSFADAKAAAKLMAKVKGYAVVNWEAGTRDGGVASHEMAIHRKSGSDTITFFDPGRGEFQFKRSQAEQFLKDLMEEYMPRNCTSFTWDVRPVQMHGSIQNTPLADVGRKLVEMHASGAAPRTINDI